MSKVNTYLGADITEGWWDMPASVYHADPCPMPSLSSSICKILVDQSPAHARLKHPRLTAQPEPEALTREMCIGSAVHALALGKGAAVVPIDADSYRTALAQAARDAALARGEIPVLAPDMEKVRRMAPPLRAALEDVLGREFLSETVGVAHGRFWRRIMIDACTPDFGVIVDVKTTVSAQPEAFARQVANMGYDVSEVFYRDVIDWLAPETEKDRRFFFIAQERDMPEAITIHETDTATRLIAGHMVNRAYEAWAEALETERWPAYARGPHTILAQPWRLRQMEEMSQ